MNKQVIQTDKAPAAGGPYSQAIVANGTIYSAGQLGVIPGTRNLAGGIREQTQQALENIKAVLAAAGAGMENVVKTTVFLTDVNDFAAMNEVYVTFFPSNPPARSTVGVAKLPNVAALVEIEVVAVL